VPFLESTETTMQALRHAREHRHFLDRPVAARAETGAPRPTARPEGRGVLANVDAERSLREFGSPLAETIPATHAEAAARAAGRGWCAALAGSSSSSLATYRCACRRSVATTPSR